MMHGAVALKCALAPASLLLVLVATLSCGDHDRLAKTEAGGAGGTGGEGASPTTSATGGAGTGGTGGIEEPPGPTRLTVVNGIVDAPAARVCFLAYPTASGSETAWPASGNLAFARGSAIDPIADVIPSSGDVALVGVTGNLAATGTQACTTLIANPPSGVVVSSLGVLPESVFVEQKSILVVLTGCVGGASHTDPAEALICGPGYASDTPSATVIAGFMSRLNNPNRVSLQFAQASFGLDESVVRFRPALTNAVSQIVEESWGWGAIAPFPPFMAYGMTQLFGSVESAVEISDVDQPQALSTITLGTALSNAGISQGDILDGDTLALIGVGAAPPLGAGSWWNAFTFTAAMADP